VVVVLPDSQVAGKLSVHATSSVSLDLKEMTVAAWVMEHGRPAGRYTDTLPSSQFLFMPLIAEQKTRGVLGLCPKESRRFSANIQRLAEVFAQQLAIGLEREHLHELGKRALVAEESERFSTALINCVSHELKTPLSEIRGASSALLQPGLITDPTVVNSLLGQIHDGTLRLTRLVENLLEMSRIEGGAIKLRLQAVDIHDLMGVLLGRMAGKLGERCNCWCLQIFPRPAAISTSWSRSSATSCTILRFILRAVQP
jgi:two-component system, OmpR family, sensor histidine kinase KdpD